MGRIWVYTMLKNELGGSHDLYLLGLPAIYACLYRLQRIRAYNSLTSSRIGIKGSFTGHWMLMSIVVE